MDLRKRAFIITILVLIFLLSAVTACQNASPSIPESVPNPVDDTAVQENLDTADLPPEPQQPVQASVPSAEDNVVDSDSAAETELFAQGDDTPDQDDDDDEEDDLDDDEENELDDEEDDLNDNDDDSLVENNKQHPVATALAEEFNVDYEEIVALHQAGYGFGEIAKAYALADELGLTPQEILPQAQEMGWGKLLKSHGLHPSMAGKGNNLGAIMSEQTGQGNRPAQAGPPGSDGPPGLLKKGK